MVAGAWCGVYVWEVSVLKPTDSFTAPFLCLCSMFLSVLRNLRVKSVFRRQKWRLNCLFYFTSDAFSYCKRFLQTLQTCPIILCLNKVRVGCHSLECKGSDSPGCLCIWMLVFDGDSVTCVQTIKTPVLPIRHIQHSRSIGMRGTEGLNKPGG